MRKVIVYIACSMDGYIAGPNDDLGFLHKVEKPGEDYGYGQFIESIDTVIMGRKTYEKVMSMVSEFPHASRECYVMTSTPRMDSGKTTFYTGDLRQLVVMLTQQNGRDIFIDGGAEIINSLMKDNLVDEFIISTVPVILGDGTPLFKGGRPEADLEFVSVRHFDTGLVQLHYSVIKKDLL